jgi:hypothetical protein
LQKLQQDGWYADRSEYDIHLTHPDVETKRQARARLKKLGIDPKEVCIIEDEDGDTAELTEGNSAAV